MNVTQKARKTQKYLFLKSRRNERNKRNKGNHRTEVDGPKGKVKIDFIMKSQFVKFVLIRCRYKCLKGEKLKSLKINPLNSF